MDITEIILHDHHDQRRQFAQLEDIPRSNIDALGAVWTRLSTALEVHAAAEEALFYPHLLQLGRAARDEHVGVEVIDVIKDHNEIRDAIVEVAPHAVGGDDWWQAVRKANKANSDHAAEEERDDLADFRRYASLQLRHDAGLAFVAFEAAHVAGVPVRDRDPQRYVAENT